MTPYIGESIGPWIRTVSETDKAYIAGFVDGEGSIQITRKHAVFVVIGQNDPRPLRWMTGRYRGHLRLVQRHVKHPTWQDHWTLTITGNEAWRLLEDIEPYLIVKPEQARLAIDLRAIKRQGPRGGLRRRLSDAEVAERESYRLAMLDLRVVA